MEIDEDKIDEAALALFYLTLHDKFGRAWKQIDWSITDRLYEKGYIHDPVGKSKSVVLTEEGLAIIACMSAPHIWKFYVPMEIEE